MPPARTPATATAERPLANRALTRRSPHYRMPTVPRTDSISFAES